MTKQKKDLMSILLASGVALAGVGAITALTVLHIKGGNDAQQTIPGQPPTGPIDPVDPVDPVDPPITIPEELPEYVKDAYVKMKTFDYSDPNNAGEIGFLPLDPTTATEAQIKNFKEKEWLKLSHFSLFGIANLQNNLDHSLGNETLNGTNDIFDEEMSEDLKHIWTASELFTENILKTNNSQEDFFVWKGLLQMDEFLNAFKWFAHTEEVFMSFMQPSLWDDLQNYDYVNDPDKIVQWDNLTHGIHKYNPGNPDNEKTGNYFDENGNFIEGTNKVNGYELAMAQRNADFDVNLSVRGTDGTADATGGPRFIYDQSDMTDITWNQEDHQDQSNWYKRKSTNMMGRLGLDDEMISIMESYDGNKSNYPLNVFMHEMQHSMGYPHNGGLQDVKDNPNAENLDAIDVYALMNGGYAKNGAFSIDGQYFGGGNSAPVKAEWFNEYNAANGTNWWWTSANGDRPTYDPLTSSVSVKKENYLNDIRGSVPPGARSWGVTGADLARMGVIPKASDMAGQWERGEFADLPLFTWAARAGTGAGGGGLKMGDWEWANVSHDHGHEFCDH